MKNTNYLSLVLIIVSIMSCRNNPRQGNLSDTGGLKPDIPVYIGTFTEKESFVDGKAEGIYLLKMDGDNGHLVLDSSVTKISNPAFLSISPDNKNLYAISEISKANGEHGFVYAYEISKENSLNFINKLSSGSSSPCHVCLDHKGKYVFVANYQGGVVMMYKRMQNGGLLMSDSININGLPQSVQGKSHAHEVVIAPDNRFVFVPDLGNDKIWIFKLDYEKGLLVQNKQAFIEVQEGAGPRHFVFHINGRYAYVINELDNTINAFSYDSSKGELTDLQSVTTLPKAYEGESYCAEIQIHPNGRFIYGSNRGHNSIVGFKIDEDTGKLSLIEHVPTRGYSPRSFEIDPGGHFLYAANQNSDNIVLFNINPENGQLSFIEQIEVKTPVCIVFRK